MCLIKEIQPEEKKEETDLEVISDIQQENKEDKKPKIQEERKNEISRRRIFE